MAEMKECPIHKEPMYEKDGKYGKFFSHRTDDPKFPSGWCSGKVKEDKDEKVMNALRKLYEVVAENNRMLRAIQIVSTKYRPKEDVDPEEIDL